MINTSSHVGALCALLVLLAACADPARNAARDDQHHSSPPSTVPADAPGYANAIPAPPNPGEARVGLTYSIYITSPATGDTVAFTVFEPTLFEGGQKYPLILYGHGGGEQRVRDSEDPSAAFSPLNNPKIYRDAGYGVISMDQRGHGESGGTIRLMDPDYEGLDLLALLDWAEARLDWLDYGPSVDGSDPHNLKLGSIGGSYGGSFQALIQNIDPKRRLDAIIPETTWYDANASIAPNGVLKSLWSLFLTLRLSAPGNEPDPSKLDPYVREMMLGGLTGNRFSDEQREFLYYHSNAYFCSGVPVATNGGPGTAPLFPPDHPGRINALFIQGMRDTLFNLNEAWSNYQCYRSAGGDVRLMTYQFGHNATPVAPDSGVQPTVPGPDTRSPPLDSFTNTCGSLSSHAAGLAFMNEHVKGIPGAADGVPGICLSLAAEDGVSVEHLTTGRHGIEAEIPATNLVSGAPDAPVPVDLGIIAGDEGDVVGGIPQVRLSISPAFTDAPSEPVIYVGVGRMRSTRPGAWELLDNQVTPVRGTGNFDLPLVGIAERLAPGDRIGLLLYGWNDQYTSSGSINLPVTVQGKAWVPLLGPLPSGQR